MTVLSTRWQANRLSITILIILAAGLISSLFFKERWLWMDEVSSYVLLSDPSLGHANKAVVSGLEANPPLTMNAYWLLGHGISMSPMFLRSCSVLFFALTVALFYRYTTRLLGRPIANFVVLTVFVCLTYLNFTLATQVRSYALFSLLHMLFFLNSHRLATAPKRLGVLLTEVVLGTAVVYAHNFGLLYVATMAAFFFGLLVWSRRLEYLRVLGALAAVGGIWFIGWFANFRLQSQIGKPHSWIPLPTFQSFFHTVGDLLPTVSASLEAKPYLQFLPMLRVVAILGLIVYLGLPRLRQGYTDLVKDPAAMFFIQASFVAVGTTVLTLIASFTVASVFLNRYMWPNHLLFAAVVIYAYHYFFRAGTVPGRRIWLPAYAVLLLPFIFYQNRKVVIFPSVILPPLAGLNPQYPMFFESADYFLPVWYQHLRPNSYFLLDWPAALKSPTLSSTIDYGIIVSLRDIYHVPQVVRLNEFNAKRFPHFYVMDQHSHYQIEEFLEAGRVRVVRTIPTSIAGHQILECTFAEPAMAGGAGQPATAGIY
ncbi:hypothetical protein FNT36_22000 [Hymenobacter setariae]|uniref:Glycosyltransferase RgtA/B/C/D-like domain-containing protein n=1 Tax=Hymenobacter setariae TaxID=2594794 RepID=A0A558BMV0_9BACT|nr:hypothetical protein [Hymenobacter setariae]TVT37838.1 hypothetical protein FNT36_22000 [Hymenobacter setariae]